MKKISISVLFVLFVSLLIAVGVSAQTNELTLKMSRDFGYGGFNGDIQGLFSMHVTGPADLAKVTFYLDQTVLGEVDKAPFNLQFKTDDYPLGLHDLYAVGNSSSGQEYRSNIVKANFVPASASGKVILPVLGVIFGAIIIAALVPLLSRRKVKSLPLGAERNYGAGGGAICPRCQRPFAISFMSPHLGFSKLAICPYCGKVSLLAPQPLAKLRDAERAELQGDKATIPQASEEDKLKKDIDDSKYRGF